MRLICPNCGAQYEVPDEVIPAAGRDVQCSSCGHTWFQAHADHLSEAESEADAPAPEDDVWAPEAAEGDAAEPEAHEAAPQPDPAPAAEADDPRIAAAPKRDAESDASAEARRRGLDPSVAGILRDEAEREVAARKAAAETIETQPDLGLDEPMDEEARRAEQARVRMARMRGLPDEEPATPRPESGASAGAEGLGTSRRDLLPDIDEINSTLRSTSERRARENGDAEGDTALPAIPEARLAMSRSGFRRGFMLAVLVFAMLTAIYVFAPQIAAQVPALEPALVGYVEMVNAARVGLSNMVGGLLSASESAET